MPRPRYLAFRIDGPKALPRRAVANAIREAAKGWDAVALGAPPQLTRYAWPDGIVRVEHTGASEARRLLAAIGRIEGDAVRVQPISTSGTLKALTTRTGVLRERTD